MQDLYRGLQLGASCKQASLCVHPASAPPSVCWLAQCCNTHDQRLSGVHGLGPHLQPACAAAGSRVSAQAGWVRVGGAVRVWARYSPIYIQVHAMPAASSRMHCWQRYSTATAAWGLLWQSPQDDCLKAGACIPHPASLSHQAACAVSRAWRPSAAAACMATTPPGTCSTCSRLVATRQATLVLDTRTPGQGACA